MNKTRLKQIIKEELETVLREERKDDMQKYAAGYRLSDKMHQRIEKQYADARAKKAAKDKKPTAAKPDPKAIIEFPMHLFKQIEKDADRIRGYADIEHFDSSAHDWEEVARLIGNIRGVLKSVAKDKAR
jgi:hypothetical protein